MTPYTVVVPRKAAGMRQYFAFRGILNGTPESIYAATVALVERCKQYPNFVLSSGCDIPPSCSWENIKAFFKACDDAF